MQERRCQHFTSTGTSSQAGHGRPGRSGRSVPAAEGREHQGGAALGRAQRERQVRPGKTSPLRLVRVSIVQERGCQHFSSQTSPKRTSRRWQETITPTARRPPHCALLLSRFVKCGRVHWWQSHLCMCVACRHTLCTISSHVAVFPVGGGGRSDEAKAAAKEMAAEALAKRLAEIDMLDGECSPAH